MDNALGLTLILAAPLILAVLGGYAGERSGVINIGLEGMMLGACAAAAIGAVAWGPTAGVGLAVVAAIGLSLVHWAATQIYGIDHVVSGMAVNALGLGGSGYLAQALLPPEKSSGIPHWPVEWFVGIALALTGLTAWFARNTAAGLRLRAVGSDPEKARLAGLDPPRIRFGAQLFAGVACGLAGAMLVARAEAFTTNMTDGRGYIALAALILGGWRPIPAVLAALLFGLAGVTRLLLEGRPVFGVDLPSQAWGALPYLVTLLALGVFAARTRAPAGLGKY
jgi:simple sugar transport system permease protein